MTATAKHTTQAKPAADTTLVTAAAPGELSPLEAALMDACNELHDARSQGDASRAERVLAHALLLLDRYDATDGENHPSPAWARANQRALVLSAAGRLSDAVRLEQVALRYADSPRRREISLDNLADRCMRLGRHEDAVGYFLAAHEESPTSVPVMLTGAQALWLAGHTAEADAIFAALRSMPAQLAPGGTVGAYLDHEARLRVMAADLPNLAALFEDWNARKAARNGGRS